MLSRAMISIRALLLCMLFVACGGAPPVSSAEPDTPERPVELACADQWPPPGSPAERLEWMVGTWVSEEEGAVTTERWCRGEGGALVGDSTTRADGEVVHSEVLRIEGRGGRLVYIASPSGQATTEFTGDARCGSDQGNCSRSCEAVFENPEHDFPNTLTYGRCVQNDLLVATIAGGERRASWTFRPQ